PRTPLPLNASAIDSIQSLPVCSPILAFLFVCDDPLADEPSLCARAAPPPRTWSLDRHVVFSFETGRWNGPLPAHTKCVAYAFSSFGSPVLVKRRRCFGSLPQRMYAVHDGFRFRS